MSNELITTKELNAVELFKDGGIDKILNQISTNARAIVVDISTAKGRKDCASIAAKVSKSKTFLDDMGKTYVAELKALPKLIDAERKKARDFLDNLKEEIRKPLTDWEQAEEKRKQDITARIASMNIPEEELTLEGLKEFYSRVENVVIDDSFYEFEGFAKKTKDESLLKIEGLIARKEREIKEAEEAEKARKEAEEKERQEREARIAQEAAERATKEAEAKAEAERQASLKREQEAREAAERAERDKIAAEERAKLEQEMAVKAERERLEQIERDKKAKAEAERIAAEKKAANKKHMAKINNEILAAIVSANIIRTEPAKELIAKIAKGEIPHVTINY